MTPGGAGRRRILIGRAVLALTVLGASFAFAAWRRGRTILDGPPPVAAATVPVAPVARSATRGRHLVEDVLACTACHDGVEGARLGPTPDGPRDLATWDAIVRRGVGADGRPLVGMPTRRWRTLSDRDLGDLAAHVAGLPPVRPNQAGRGVLVAVGAGLGNVRVDASVSGIDVDPRAKPPAPDAGYGAYLARVAGCPDCHADRGPTALDAWRVRTGAAWAEALHDERPRVASHHPGRGWDTTERDALWRWLRRE